MELQTCLPCGKDHPVSSMVGEYCIECSEDIKNNLLEIMTTTKQDFIAFLEVQRSGQTNMMDVRAVQALSGLEREQIVDIMSNYEKYEIQFGVDIESLYE